jgi:hypothetical protein
MWEPRRLTTLWTFTACYADRFTSFLHSSSVYRQELHFGLTKNAQSLETIRSTLTIYEYPTSPTTRRIQTIEF